jgi:uncharacterized membrane protein
MAESDELADVVQRNIRAMLEYKRAEEQRLSVEDRVAAAFTRFAGSMRSVYAHVAVYGGWIALNSGIVPGFEPPDPFPFVGAAMAASVEALFLSTFVLMRQNQMARVADRRADLDLQINLLAEHEITRMITLVAAIADRVGVEDGETAAVDDLEQDVAPERVLEAIERSEDALRDEPL